MATSAIPSNTHASPSPVICQTASAMIAERADVDRVEHEGQPVVEEQREQHERGVEEHRDLRDRVLDHRDREVGCPFAARVMPTTFSTALPAIPTITRPVNAFEMPSASTAGSSESTNQSETNAALTPASASTPIAGRSGRIGVRALLDRGLGARRSADTTRARRHRRRASRRRRSTRSRPGARSPGRLPRPRGRAGR